MPGKSDTNGLHDQAELIRMVGVPDPWVSFLPITTRGLQTQTEPITILLLSTHHLQAIQRQQERGIKSLFATFCLWMRFSHCHFLLSWS
jgi:hypothetical protein